MKVNLFDHLKEVQRRNRTAHLTIDAQLRFLIQSIQSHNVECPDFVKYQIAISEKCLVDNPFVEAEIEL